MTNQLIALLDGREVGTVHYKDSRLSFAYSDAWRNDPNAYPLSLSMPLGSTTHGHARIEAFLWGLLPDNDRVLQNWGKRFQVSSKNVFSTDLACWRGLCPSCSVRRPGAA